MTTVKQLVVALEARTAKFDKRIAQSQRRLDGFSKRASAGFAHVHRAAIAMSAGVALAFKDGIDDLVQVEASFSRFAARTGGSVAALRERYEDEVDAISVLTGVAATQIVDAFQLAESAGASGQRAIDLVTRAAKSQAAGLTSAAQAVDAATTVADKFAVSYTHGLNAITVASQLGKGGVDDFATAAKQTGPLASALGVSLADTAAAIADISLRGSGIVEGTTQLRAFLGSLLKPTGEAEKALKELGRSLGLPDYDAAAVRERIRAGGLVDVLREFKALDQGQLGRILDRTSVEFVLAVEPASIADLSRRVEAGLADATSRAFDQGENDLDRYLARLRARWDVAARGANDGLLKTFTDIQGAIEAGGGDLDAVFETLAGGLRAFTEALAAAAVVAFEYRHLVGWIAAGIAAVVTATAGWHLLSQAWTIALGVGRAFIGWVAIPLVKALGWLAATALPAVGKAFLAIGTKVLPVVASPIAGIVAAVGVFAYLASVVFRAWEPIKTFFVSLWDGIKAGAEVVWLYVRNAFLNLKDNLVEFLSGLGENVNAALAAVPGIDWQLPTLDESERTAIDNARTAREAELAAATTGLAQAMGGVVGALGDAATGIGDVVGSDIERVKSAWRSVVDGAGDLADTAATTAGILFDVQFLTPVEKLLGGLRSGFPSSPADRPDFDPIDAMSEYYAAIVRDAANAPAPSPRFDTPTPTDAELAVATTDMEPPAETAATALSDALRSAFRDGDLSDVGRTAFARFREAIADEFFDRLDSAFANVFDDDPKTGFLAGLLNFGGGGEVPGPEGRPRLAVVHGGEVVLTPAQQRLGGGTTVTQNISVQQDIDERVLDTLRRHAWEVGLIARGAG